MSVRDPTSSPTPGDDIPRASGSAGPRASVETAEEPAVELDEAAPAVRISFYVQCFDEMLQAVADKEAFLFDSMEQLAMQRFIQMDYEAKYLFIRLYLRKRGFIRLSLLEYKNDIKDLAAACQSLWESVPLELPAEEIKTEDVPPSSVDVKPVLAAVVKVDNGIIDLTMSDDEDDVKPVPLVEADIIIVKPTYSRVAEGKEALVELGVEATLNLLYADELVALGKRMKVTCKGVTRRDWQTALLSSNKQATLFFTPVSKKGKSKASTPTGSLSLGYDAQGNKLKQSGVVTIQALKTIGEVVRLHHDYVTLFDRLCLVYYRTSYTSTSTSSLTSALLARFGKRVYPTYPVKRTFSIFGSMDLLREYEQALEAERKMEEYLGELSMSGPPPPKQADGGKEVAEMTKEQKKKEREEGWAEGIKLFDGVWPSWKAMCRDGALEIKKEKASDGKDEQKLLYYRKRFHPGWPLTRVVYKAAGIFARLHDRPREIEILRALLKQQSFRRGKRGEWYDRLALLLMRYPSAEEEMKTCGPKKKARLAKGRLSEAVEICVKGLSDPFCHLIYHSSLSRRILRLEGSLEVDKSQRMVFQELLAKAETRVMEGDRLDDAIIGRKSIWSGNDGSELSVEALALEQYIKEGWKGFHSESSILTCIFSLCMWDIIFHPVDGVFETAYQSAPLDLSTDAFAIVRGALLEERLDAIEKGRAGEFLEITDDRERPRKTWCVGVSWDLYSKEDLLEIVECLGAHAVAVICRMFAEEFNHRTGGIPDLCLWNPEEGVAMFSEVKGPGDKLSETQKVWIDVLLGAGVRVELCKVMTSAEKDLMEKKQRDTLSRKKKANGKTTKRKRGSDDEEEEEEEQEDSN